MRGSRESGTLVQVTRVDPSSKTREPKVELHLSYITSKEAGRPVHGEAVCNPRRSFRAPSGGGPDAFLKDWQRPVTASGYPPRAYYEGVIFHWLTRTSQVIRAAPLRDPAGAVEGAKRFAIGVAFT